jgi:hypothetical protein
VTIQSHYSIDRIGEPSLVPSVVTESPSQKFLQKVHALSCRTFSLSRPFKDKMGRKIQLWSVPDRGLIGTVIDDQNKMTIINSCKIHNGLNPSEIGKPLYKKLLASTNDNWDLVILPSSEEIYVWPHLVAAGKGNPSPIWVETSPMIGCSAKQIHEMLLRSGYEERGGNPFMGRGSYVHERRERTFRFDRYGHGAFPDEPSHMDVTFKGPDGKTIKRRFAFDNMPGGDGPVIKRGCSRETLNSIRRAVRPWQQQNFSLLRQQFIELLQQTRLTSSYNSSNPNAQVPPKGSSGGQTWL